jgi:hypothetical protein
MRRLGVLFVANATWRRVGILGGVALTFNALFIWLGAGLPQTPDTLGFVGGDALVECITALGPHGIETYQPIALFDLSYPFVYATFLSFLLALLISGREGDVHGAGDRLLLPWLGAFADWCENVSVLRYLDQISLAAFLEPGGKTDETLLTTWSVAHNAKWVILGGVVVLLLVELARFKRHRDRLKPPPTVA